MFDPHYVNIGNSEIINTRGVFPVKIEDYGFIGDYVPFYFGKQSIMLYNILTGRGGVRKQSPEDIVYLCCGVAKLINECPRYFFTDGQANKQLTEHFSSTNDLDKIDWDIVNGSDFKKTQEQPDKSRRYQAEFLVHQHVPVSCINKIVIYNKSAASIVEALLKGNGLRIPLRIAKKDSYYFYF